MTEDRQRDDHPARDLPPEREDLRAEAGSRAADAEAPRRDPPAGSGHDRRRRAGLIGGALLALVIVAAGVWWLFLRDGGGDQQAQGGGGPRTVTVTAGAAEARTWQPRLRAVGTIQAYRSIMVTTEVPGQVEEVAFESGATVRRGEVLLMLDSGREEARLEDLLADLQLARVQLARQRELAQDGYASEEDVDQAQARFQSAQAKANAQRELIDQMTIRAPFDGELGIRRINEGAYLQPGEPVVSLAQLDPLRVIFSMPQQRFSAVEKGLPVTVSVSAWPERTFDGTVTAVDPVFSERTRTFSVEARLDNSDRALRPGMFGDVTLRLPERREVVTIPQTALSYNPYGDFVFVVEEQAGGGRGQGQDQGQGQGGDPQQAQGGQGGPQGQGPHLVARRQFVTAGERRGTQIAIPEGLEAGTRVVTSGLFKLQDGMPLRIDNSITPPSQAEVQQVEY